VKGRVMKVDLSKNEFDPRLYDCDNGQGEAQHAIDGLAQYAADGLIVLLEELSDTIAGRWRKPLGPTFIIMQGK